MFLRPLVGRLWLACLALCLLAVAAPAQAQPQPPVDPGSEVQGPGDDLTVSVITFGPGDHAFFKFGHDAILIENKRGKGPMREVVYNWGTFDFGPGLIPKFVLGKFMYWLSRDTYANTKRIYKGENRTIEKQTLRLTGKQKWELLLAVEDNARNENKYYKYDYYRDNCATRVRDVIDRAVGGRLKAASQERVPLTWRQHTVRLTQDDLVLTEALSVVMGSVIDKPLTQWEEMFLPAKVQEGLRRVTVPGPDGTELPLVSEETLVVSANRAPVHTEVPRWTGVHLFLGALLGAALAFLGTAAARHLGARIALAAGLFFAGLLCILGVLFVFVWIFTDHEVGWHNENILQLCPWAVSLLGFSIGVLRRRPKAVLRAYHVVRACLVAAGLGAVLKVLPWFRQENAWFMAFAIPMWAGALFGLRSMYRLLATAKPAAPAPAQAKAEAAP